MPKLVCDPFDSTLKSQCPIKDFQRYSCTIKCANKLLTSLVLDPLATRKWLPEHI